MLRKLVLTLFSIVAAFSLSAQEIDKTQPYQMMKQVSEKAFERLKGEQELIKQDPDYLKVIVEEELMPYVNYRYASLKLLGSNLRGADRADVGVFIEAFRGYLVTSYAQALTLYTDQTIEFEPEPRLDPSRSITGVKLDILEPPRPNVQIEFRLRKDRDSGEWQAFDMIAEGISLLSSKQSEWSGKLRREGILSVAKDLEELAAQPIRFESQSNE